MDLRSNADNFSFEEMREGVEFAKRYGAKVFVATNIYAHNEDIEGLKIISQDFRKPGFLLLSRQIQLSSRQLRRVAPKLEVHLSTQQSTLELAGR